MPTARERWESYLYPQAETSWPIRALRNKFDEHNAVMLDLLEKSATALRVGQLNSGQAQIRTIQEHTEVDDFHLLEGLPGLLYSLSAEHVLVPVVTVPRLGSRRRQTEAGANGYRCG